MLAHPECRQEVLALADYIGSTSGIIEFATKSENEAFIVCTEMGVLYELKQKNPHKRFYTAGQDQILSGYEADYAGKNQAVLRNHGA